MRPRIVHRSTFVLLMVVGCAGIPIVGDAERQAQALHAAVSGAIDCAEFSSAPVEVEARAAGGSGGSRATVGSALKIRLHALGEVFPVVTPGRKERPDTRFAGLVPFRVDARGTYTVLVASLAWADLAEENPARLVESLGFAWVQACGKRFKSGLYALEPGRDYVVQLWDSPDRDLVLMVRRLR